MKDEKTKKRADFQELFQSLEAMTENALSFMREEMKTRTRRWKDEEDWRKRVCWDILVCKSRREKVGKRGAKEDFREEFNRKPVKVTQHEKYMRKLAKTI